MTYLVVFRHNKSEYYKGCLFESASENSNAKTQHTKEKLMEYNIVKKRKVISP